MTNKITAGPKGAGIMLRELRFLLKRGGLKRKTQQNHYSFCKEHHYIEVKAFFTSC